MVRGGASELVHPPVAHWQAHGTWGAPWSSLHPRLAASVLPQRCLPLLMCQRRGPPSTWAFPSILTELSLGGCASHSTIGV